MKKVLIAIGIVAVVLAVLIVPQCVDKFGEVASENETYIESPNLTTGQRIKILESQIAQMKIIMAEMQKDNAQMERDMIELQRQLDLLR